MHKKYLEQLCQDFESKVKDMITESIAEHKAAETENVVYVEVAQHMLFCKRKIAAVCRRESTLKVQSEAWSPYISLKRVSGRTFLTHVPFLDVRRFLGNCPPNPPLSHRFVLSEK